MNAGWDWPSTIPHARICHLSWKNARGALTQLVHFLLQNTECVSEPLLTRPQAGRLEASACIRYYHFELCPVGALADRVVCEFLGPRLTLATLAKSHVLRAPGSLGDKPMSASWFTVQVGQVLRDAGKLCGSQTGAAHAAIQSSPSDEGLISKVARTPYH